MRDTNNSYDGFEQGPIRPPSEAHSLLIRVARNCPWNRCRFCPVYKGTKFSFRPVAHIKRDIDRVRYYADLLRDRDIAPDTLTAARPAIEAAAEDRPAARAAFHWALAGGMKSVFLQDADALVVSTDDLVAILTHIRECFPEVQRVTAYSRSHTIALKKDADLGALAAAGLNRIHVGLESGCDEVLARVKKGATKDKHIAAGLKVKQAGIELSEYVMPGLGGRRLSHAHARETAEVLNQIDPDFIRIRTLAIPEHVPLIEDCRNGRFDKCPETMVVTELLSFIENLNGITSKVRSDHILNLFGDLEGDLPDDRDRMAHLIREFLALPPHEQTVYRIGRRMGVFRGCGDLLDERRRARAKRACDELGATPENVDDIMTGLVARYI